MFKIRAVLASMMSPTWGVYSGFELFEHVAVRPGSEEYHDSEKYRLRPRDWAGAEASGRSLAPYLRRDRKSTRLNSSHANISYAVFCLKKKKTKTYKHMPCT